ncbi:MAG: hypothetical protein B6229_02600 [Spirochaetaceae bacterium 4572_7]|nr:MAG: hypothetical protein B6229_02600 [Spirochaetaceae bacterium 4572_7]
MTKERLELLDDDILTRLAKKVGIKVNRKWSRQEFISTLVDAMAEDRLEKESLLNLALSAESKKYSVTINEELDLSYDVDEEMFLPERYNETMLHLLFRDNSWGFVLWDIKDKVIQKYQRDLGKLSYTLRIVELDQEVYSKESILYFFDVVVSLGEKRRYISLPNKESFYCAELIICSEFKEDIIARSQIIKTSRENINYIPGVNDNLENITTLSGFSFFDSVVKKSSSLNRILPIDNTEEEVD